MKFILGLLTFASLLTSVYANESKLTCFSTTEYLPKNVPSTFCLEYAQLDNEYKYLMFFGNSARTPSALKIKEYQYITEDKIKFVAESSLVSIWESGCGDGEEASLIISGIREIGTGEEINVKELKISVNIMTTNDTCHSYPQSETINYALVK